MYAALLIAAFAVLPRGELFVRQQTTALERNHTYDDSATRLFTQVIAWDDPNVCFWVMDNSGALHPDYDHERRVWVLRFVDKDGTCRAVYSRTYFERHLQYDVEVFDRENLPVDQRRGLRRSGYIDKPSGVMRPPRQ